MAFYCQRNCYEEKFISNVKSCVPSKTDVKVNGKISQIECYEIVFEDTVFFPEGGGQPCDTGLINNIPVIKVLRRGGVAVHYLPEPIEVDSYALLCIDWMRRHDHMQQHTAQHLITAIADKNYNSPTLSWNLGELVSFVELDIPDITKEQCKYLENSVNECIKKSIPVITEDFEANDPKLQRMRTRGLPDNVFGPVRVVTIKNLDSNMCCGTHVNNLAELQAIKILYAEKGKAGNTRLYFVAGRRLLQYFEDCFDREKEFNVLLHCCPSDHLRIAEKNRKDLKKSLKSLSDAFKDLASAEVFRFNQISPRPKLFFHHRRDGDANYLGHFIREFDDDDVLKVLTAGEEAGPGLLVIHGMEEYVQAIAPGVCDILEGKGGGRTRFSAKIGRPGKWKQAEQYVRQTLPQLT